MSGCATPPQRQPAQLVPPVPTLSDQGHVLGRTLLVVRPDIDLLQRDDGLILARDAARVHGEHARLIRAVDRGEIVRVHRGAFVRAELWHQASPWQRYRLRCRAVALVNPGIVLSHAAAAALWGVPLLRYDRSVDCLADGVRAGRPATGVVYRGTRHPSHRVVELDGVLVTDLPRTLAELSARGTFADGVVALDWAIHAVGRSGDASATKEQVLGAASELEIVRGGRRLASAVGFADGRAESPGESLSRVLMLQLGFVIPDLQHEFVLPGVGVVRTDFRWPRQRLVGEFDGMSKYRAAELRGGRTVEQVVIDEKLREDAVRRHGETVGRWVWGDLRAPSRFAAVMRALGVPRT